IKMIIYVDADACPVQNETIEVADLFSLEVVLVKSYSHYSHDQLADHVRTIYVDPGNDMADFEIVKLAQQQDIIITHDYGLAAICLGKKCTVIHPKGFRYTNKNIDRLLQTRHDHALMRRAGQRTRGPRAFTTEDKQKFTRTLTTSIQFLLKTNINEQ